MIGDNIAVIDLGTNSFHLLIATIEEHGFEELVKKKEFVHLASNGIENISDEAFDKGLAVIKEFKRLMQEYSVRDYRIVGTAGMRIAKNSEDFRKHIYDEFDMRVDVIDGDTEAELIYHGVKTAVMFNGSKRLIMDIGGGSTEFIIANSKQIFWKKSFPLGARVLANKFHTADPISTVEFQKLVGFLEHELTDLWEQIDLHQPIGLVGASGSFRSLVNLQQGLNQIFPVLEEPSDVVNVSGFRVAHLTMLKSTLKERLRIMEVEPERAPIMPVATTLISVVLTKMPHNRSITVSHHALKEGLLWKMREQYFAEV